MKAKTVSSRRRAGMRKGNGRKTLSSDLRIHDNNCGHEIGHGSKPNHQARARNQFVTDMVRVKVEGVSREIPYEPKFISDDHGNRMRNPNWSGA